MSYFFRPLETPKTSNKYCLKNRALGFPGKTVITPINGPIKIGNCGSLTPNYASITPLNTGKGRSIFAKKIKKGGKSYECACHMVNPIIKVIEFEHQPNKQIQETSYGEEERVPTLWLYIKFGRANS